jgi:hypothetical protein
MWWLYNYLFLFLMFLYQIRIRAISILGFAMRTWIRTIITLLMSTWIEFLRDWLTFIFSRWIISLLSNRVLLLLDKTRFLMNLIFSIVFIGTVAHLGLWWLLFLSCILINRLFLAKTLPIYCLSIIIKVLTKSYTEIPSNLNLCYLFEL